MARDVTPVSVPQVRVADYVLYEKRNAMYCIVGEIKSDNTSATAQQIEQMVGLFRKTQQAMLGFTCNRCTFRGGTSTANLIEPTRTTPSQS